MRGESALSDPIVAIYAKREPAAGRLLEYLGHCGGVCRESVDQVANRVGLRDRFAIGRCLQRAGLPPFTHLKDLVWLEARIRRWKTERSSLRQQALAVGARPKRWYQKVKKLTGRSWKQIRDRGTGWILEEIELGRRSRPQGGDHKAIGGG